MDVSRDEALVAVVSAVLALAAARLAVSGGLFTTGQLRALATLAVAVCIVVAFMALQLAGLVAAALGQRGASAASGWVYRFGGGVPHDEAGTQTPKPPYDRLWVEVSYLENIFQYIEMKLGGRNWVNPLERPNLDELYRVREKHWSDDE